jgi:hypothetical protein
MDINDAYNEYKKGDELPLLREFYARICKIEEKLDLLISLPNPERPLIDSEEIPRGHRMCD